MRKPVTRKVIFMQKASVCLDAAVLRDTAKVTVGEHTLRKRAEGNNPFSMPFCSIFQAVFFNRPVKDGISVLIDDERAAQAAEDFGSLLHMRPVII